MSIRDISVAQKLFVPAFGILAMMIVIAVLGDRMARQELAETDQLIQARNLASAVAAFRV